MHHFKDAQFLVGELRFNKAITKRGENESLLRLLTGVTRSTPPLVSVVLMGLSLLRVEAGGGQFSHRCPLLSSPTAPSARQGQTSFSPSLLCSQAGAPWMLAQFVKQRASKREDGQGQGDREFLEQQ